MLMETMSQEIKQTAVMLLLPLILQLLGLTFAVTADPYLNQKQRRILEIIILLTASLIAQNYGEFLLGQETVKPYGRTLVGIYGYIARPFILFLYFFLVAPKGRFTVGWILIGINTAVHLTALFSGICFSIDAVNVYHRGPLGYTCHIVSGILLLNLLVLTFRESGRLKHREAWIPFINALLIVGAVAADSTGKYHNFPMTFLTIGVVSADVFYYIWLHLQFVRSHEQDLMAQQRIRVMMSQIQPHFLYNTLSTIQALCLTDPEKASVITERLGTYLRQNLESLDQPALIPMQRELEHTRIYTEIEQTRFPDIRVEYQIEDEGFMLPALTVQPMVENAIRHGVRGKKGDGLVRVKAERLPDCHLITVRDNGKGFDPDALPEDGEAHIGIRNVRERLKTMCGGELFIESTVGEGTEVSIRIPVGGVSGTKTEQV